MRIQEIEINFIHLTTIFMNWSWFFSIWLVKHTVECFFMKQKGVFENMKIDTFVVGKVHRLTSIFPLIWMFGDHTFFSSTYQGQHHFAVSTLLTKIIYFPYRLMSYFEPFSWDSSTQPFLHGFITRTVFFWQ